MVPPKSVVSDIHENCSHFNKKVPPVNGGEVLVDLKNIESPRVLFQCKPVNQQKTTIFALILREEQTKPFLKHKKVTKLYFPLLAPKKVSSLLLNTYMYLVMWKFNCKPVLIHENILQDIFSLKLNPLGHFILGMIFMITEEVGVPGENRPWATGKLYHLRLQVECALL